MECGCHHLPCVFDGSRTGLHGRNGVRDERSAECTDGADEWTHDDADSGGADGWASHLGHGVECGAEANDGQDDWIVVVGGALFDARTHCNGGVLCGMSVEQDSQLPCT